MPSGTVRNVERDNIIRAGLQHFIRAVLLQITLVCLLATMRSKDLRAVANPPPCIEVCLAGSRVIETLQDDESGKPLDTSDRTFEDLIGGSEMRLMDDGDSLPLDRSLRALNWVRRSRSP